MEKRTFAADSRRRDKRATRVRKGAEVSVFGTTLPPAIGAYRGRAAAADRPEWQRYLLTPKITPNRSLLALMITYKSHTPAIERFLNA